MTFLEQTTRTTVARLTVAWGVVFALVHGYWAAGGAAGMNGDPADTPAAQAYIGVVTLIGLAGAGVAYGLLDARRGTVVRRRLALLARASRVALLLGVAFGTARWIADGSLHGDGAAGVATTVYFLIGGVLFLMLGGVRTPGRRGGGTVPAVGS
jgi:hypothetical protein